MNSLAAAHHRVYEEFMFGGHALMSGQTWPSSNRSMPTLKERGGIVGISQTPTALNRWFLQHVNVHLYRRRKSRCMAYNPVNKEFTRKQR